MSIIAVIYFFCFFFACRYLKILQIKGLSNWTMPFAFLVKVVMGFFFCYVYIYSAKNSAEPSDAVRFLNESQQLHDVFYKSPSDFFALLTGFGDNARMIHEHMDKTFIWDAGNFTTINDSRNTIRVHALIQFISFDSDFVHTLIMCFISLIGLQQLYLSIQAHSKLKPLFLFFGILLLPSLLFWSSSILKEPLLIVGIGFLARALLLNDGIPKRILIGSIGIAFLIAFKPYIFMCLIPSFVFFLVYKYIFKQRLIMTIGVLLALLVGVLLLFPHKKQAITENLSRKQFDLENVGKGGIHVSVGVNFYYFKPNQYKNLKIEKNYVQLIHPSDAFFMSGNIQDIPKPIHLKPNGDKWRIHIVMPGTNSYIETTSINNSFTQLIKNIPEALMNSLFRPFPSDQGNIMKYPAMIEVWLLTLFFLLAIFYHRTINSETIGIIISIALFSTCLLLLVGWTTPVVGAIVRFRFPAQLGLFIIAAILIDPQKIKFLKKHE